MDPRLADAIVKGGALGVLIVVLYWAHLERRESRREATERLMPVLESIAKDLQTISHTYAPKQ